MNSTLANRSGEPAPPEFNKCIKEVGTFLKEYINECGLSFLRDDPDTFVSRLSTVFTPFFPSPFLVEGLKQKALYCLWNIVIDDTIEYLNTGEDSIKESLKALTGAQGSKTEAGQIMHDFIHRFYSLPLGPNKTISESLLFLDLARIINGFDYERIVHNHAVGALREYLEFGTATADVRVFLDIDVALHPHKVCTASLCALREACRWFSMAVKMSSDVATFEREFFVEKSQNAVILCGQKEGLLSEDVLTADYAQKKQLFEEIIPVLMDTVKSKGRKYLSHSMACLKGVKEIDTDAIAAAFNQTFEEYPGERTFSPPSECCTGI